jgi:hypothetical protein
VFEWPYIVEQLPPPLAHRLSDKAIAEAARAAGWHDAERLALAHTVFFRFPARSRQQVRGARERATSG